MRKKKNVLKKSEMREVTQEEVLLWKEILSEPSALIDII